MSDEEEEVLLRRRPAFMGLRFKSEEHKDLILKLMLASAAEFVFSLMIIWAHLLNKGLLQHIFFHAIAIFLPVIGYIGLFRGDARLMYIFEMGNWEFAIIHTAVWLIIFSRWYRVVGVDESEACSTLAASPAELMRGQPSDAVAECMEAWRKEKDERTTLFAAWTLVTLPLWVVQMYAAYLGHEYYFQLRVQKLVMKRTGDGDQVAIVEEDNGQGTGRPLRYAEDIDGAE
mmetsp:Transcript_74067/g.176378  ORF Transcript_74067/g.176378 Transcript_74067/m.176378 type:complete len:230 (-) Transcript_74067:128-817(-)